MDRVLNKGEFHRNPKIPDSSRFQDLVVSNVRVFGGDEIDIWGHNQCSLFRMSFIVFLS